MKVVRVVETEPGRTTLVEAVAACPEPQRGEVLVRVRAAGVTTTELVWFPTTHTKAGETRTGAVPTHEFSGVVEAVGEGVEGYAPDDAVFGMNDWFAEGALADFCLAEPAGLAPKPAGLSHVDAASVPIGALTAWQGLFDRARLKSGETVLVHGGAGAVGHFAVQLAKRHGARVVATASAKDAEFVAGLGAERVIDYHAARFEDEVSGVDVVFDTVGGETLERSWSVLGPDGRMVAIAADAEGTPDERVKAAFFIVEPKGDQLATIAGMLDRGELKTFVAAVVPLVDAASAYDGTVTRAGHGKVVVSIDE